jgi:magnesium transporter
MENGTVLLPLAERLLEADVGAASEVLEAMPAEDALAALMLFPAARAARALRHVRPRYAAPILAQAPPDLLREVAQGIEPEQGAAIMLDLPEETRETFLAHVAPRTKRQIQELLTYPEDSAGRLMTTDFLAFRSDMRVEDVVLRIRALADRKALTSYTYVVDAEDRLVGVINMRDLMLARPDATLDLVMRREIFTVPAFTDREAVAHELAARKFFAAPVVDADGRLLGVVKSDHLLARAEQAATEDLQKMFGAGGDERAFSSIGFSLRKRLPWLHVNLATAFLAAAVVALFEGVIARITVLAVFLPVVAGQGGNAGAQSLAVVMRGLVMREIPRGRARVLLAKEAMVGALNGLIIGAVTAAVAWLWMGNPYLGLVIGLAMIVNLVVAGLAGAGIPLGMKALGMDPAQSSNIILTTVTDVIGFLSYLGFAVVFEPQLV